jgi:formate C-acetyltransferase
MRLLQPSPCAGKQKNSRCLPSSGTLSKLSKLDSANLLFQYPMPLYRNFFARVNHSKLPVTRSHGCVEAGAFGKEAYILTGYFNLPKILEITLNNGVDPRTGKKIGLEKGNPSGFTSFDDLLKAYQQQLRHFIDIKIAGNILIERLFAKNIPTPFLSLFIDDCIAKGKDYINGGPRYNTSYIQGVGLGSITDSLTALKYHVFDKKDVSIQLMLEALRVNFAGFEDLHHKLVYETPK